MLLASMVMIPAVFDRYIEDVKRAEALAGMGRLVAGFDCLVAGQRLAEEDLENGEPWGGALLCRYQQAVDDYIDAYGVKPAEAGPECP
jgi:hypothetical protein